MKNVAASLVLICSLAAGQSNNNRRGASTVATADASLATLSRQVDALFAPLTEGARPGAVVFVGREGTVLHKKAYGMADVSQRIPLTPATVFDLGSIGKSFTALAIMLLAEDGKLDYDDALARFFPEFATHASNVKLRHLLQHTAGFADYEDLLKKSGQVDDNYPRSARTPKSAVEPTPADIVRLLSKRTLRFQPGTKYEYSDSGYVLLGQVVAKVSGQRYATFLQQRIFRPLRMTKTVVYDETRPPIPGRAVSYKRLGDTYVDIDYSPLNFVYGDGSTNSTVEDLFKLDRALYTNALLKAATLAQAFRSGILPDGTRTEYGFGWFVRPAVGLARISHGGTQVGFRSLFVRYPQQQLVVIVLGNFLDFDRERLAYEVARLYFGETVVLPKAVSLPDSSLNALTGSYDACKWLKLGTTDCEGEIEPEDKYEVGRESMGLWLRYPDGKRTILMPVSEQEFFISGREDTRVKFHYGQQHKVTGMSITNYIQQTAQRSH